MGKISGEEGWISLGPWGGLSGEEYWDYKPDGPLMQITIGYDENLIISVLFESKSYDGVIIGSSVKVAGTTGDGRWTKTFCIDSSVEQLSSISLTYDLSNSRRRPFCGAVNTLCFETNSGNKYYGPFGEKTGSQSLSIPTQGGVITGFHGRAGVGSGSWLNSIGIFVAPNVNSLPCLGKKVDSLHSIQDPDSAPIQLKGKISDDEGFISLGPWGGKYGGDWTYKANGPIIQISICFGEAINSICFQSRSRDGLVIGSSEKFGGTGDHRTKTNTFCINSAVEQLSSISLTYKNYKGQVVIKSLCFKTNIGNKYGPFGWTTGASRSIPIEGGVTVGFHGHCGTGNYLTSIGIFVLPKVNNLASSERKFDSLDSVKVPNYAPTQLKGKISDEKGFISLGPWGEKYGGDWTYKANGPIMQISICFGDVITSIFFRSRSCDGLVIGSSEKFGSTGGHTTKTV